MKWHTVVWEWNHKGQFQDWEKSIPLASTIVAIHNRITENVFILPRKRKNKKAHKENNNVVKGQDSKGYVSAIQILSQNGNLTQDKPTEWRSYIVPEGPQSSFIMPVPYYLSFAEGINIGTSLLYTFHQPDHTAWANSCPPKVDALRHYTTLMQDIVLHGTEKLVFLTSDSWIKERKV